MHANTSNIIMGNILRVLKPPAPLPPPPECCLCKHTLEDNEARLQCLPGKTIMHDACEHNLYDNDYSVCPVCGRVGTLSVYKIQLSDEVV